MIELSPTSAFVARYRGALFIVSFSFFFMAIALAAKAIAGRGTAIDVLLPIGEIILAVLAAMLALWFPRRPLKYKPSIVVLLIAAVGLHFWLVVAHIDFSGCPFGSGFCLAVFYAYLLVLAVMAVLLLLGRGAKDVAD